MQIYIPLVSAGALREPREGARPCGQYRREGGQEAHQGEYLLRIHC